MGVRAPVALLYSFLILHYFPRDGNAKALCRKKVLTIKLKLCYNKSV